MMTHPAAPLHVVLADHFADPGSGRHPLRIRLTTGEQFDCYAPVFDFDHLVLAVTTSEGVTRELRPTDIQALSELRPRWPVYAGLISATVAPATAISALIVPLFSPLTAVHGALFGALGGAIATYIVPWLLPSLSPSAYSRLLARLGRFAYWRTVIPKADA